MLFFIRAEDSNLIEGFTNTLDAVPAETETRYILWSSVPANPAFTSEDDALERAHEVTGKILENGALREDDPPPAVYVNRMSVLQFRNRFTSAEKAAIYASTDANVRVFLDDLNAASRVDITDPTTIAGVDYLISISIVDSSRRTDLLAQVELTRELLRYQ